MFIAYNDSLQFKTMVSNVTISKTKMLNKT